MSDFMEIVGIGVDFFFTVYWEYIEKDGSPFMHIDIICYLCAWILLNVISLQPGGRAKRVLCLSLQFPGQD